MQIELKAVMVSPQAIKSVQRGLEATCCYSPFNWSANFSLGQLSVASPSLTLGSASDRSTSFHDVTTEAITVTIIDIKENIPRLYDVKEC